MKKTPKLTQEQKQEIHQYIGNSKRTSGEVRRAQAILLRDQEAKDEVIRSLTMLSERQAFSIRKKYRENGIEACQDKRRNNRERIVSKVEKAQVLATLQEKKHRPERSRTSKLTSSLSFSRPKAS